MGYEIKKYCGEFYDADDFAKEIRQGIAEHFQMEPGDFYGELIQVVSEPVIISTHSLNRTIIQSGAGLPGYTVFLLPGNMSQDFSWRKLRLTGKRIGLLKEGMPHFSVLPPNFFGTPISLSNKYFNELIIKMNFNENLYKYVLQSEAMEIRSEDAYLIQKMVIDICNSNKIDSKKLIEDLPVLMLKALDKVTKDAPIQISNSHDIIFAKFMEYINLHLDQPIKTHDICNRVEISERNLRYIFKELTGITPMKFVKNLKLNKARKDIKFAKEKTEINAIANKWGFGHSGQFAADYKKLFGELPYQTAIKSSK